MTLALMDLCKEEMARKNISLDPETDLRELVILEQVCEEGKKDLATMEKVHLTFQAKGEFFQLEVSREQFEEAIRPILGGIRTLIQETLDMAGLQPSDFDGAVLAGGGSRVLAVQNLAVEIFGEERIRRDIDPDTAVVKGAALSLGQKIREAVASGDKEMALIAEGYNLPCQEIQLQEILGSSLGVRAERSSTGEEVLAEIVPPKTSVPCEVSRVFGLKHDGAGEVNATITVLQGKADAPADEQMVLVEIPLNGLPPGPSKQRIEIFFRIDANGIVYVRAVDLFSKKEISGQADASGAVRKGTA